MNARARAIEVLARVEATDGYLNVVLDNQLTEDPPEDSRDKGLITELCYGATRRRLSLDHIIAQHSQRKLSALEDRVLAALRVGAYQIFFTRVPRRAAVGETVEALKQVGLGRATGFCNAILRKLSQAETLPLPPESQLIQHLSLKESHPEWLVTRWLSEFGRERTEAMLSANNAPPSLVVRTNTSRVTRDALLAQLTQVGLQVTPTAFSPVGLRISNPGRVSDLLGYDEGLWQVQDEAAQLVGLFSAIPEGQAVLDACAARGEACHLAEHHTVVATDLHANKLPKIAAEANRLGLLPKMVLMAHDATRPFPATVGTVGAVLVDAPCSGMGTLRRHPELRYRRQLVDLKELATLQETILENAQAVVPPGGILVYAVCSTEPEEGSGRIAAFLKAHPDFALEPSAAPRFPLTEGALRTLPGPEEMDGFFAARLRRTSAQ